MGKRPAKSKSGAAKSSESTANLGFEAKLWAAADALRNNMDAAEYKHVVIGLIFLKYISDAFEAKHAELAAQTKQGADPRHRCSDRPWRHVPQRQAPGPQGRLRAGQSAVQRQRLARRLAHAGEVRGLSGSIPWVRLVALGARHSRAKIVSTAGSAGTHPGAGRRQGTFAESGD